MTPASARLCRGISPRGGAAVSFAGGQRYDVIEMHTSATVQLDYPFSGVQFLFRFRDEVRRPMLAICTPAVLICHRPYSANRSSIISAAASTMPCLLVSGSVRRLFHRRCFRSPQTVANSEPSACRCARLLPPNNTPTELLYKCAHHSVMNLLQRNALKGFGHGKLNNSTISMTYSMVICLPHELFTVFYYTAFSLQSLFISRHFRSSTSSYLRDRSFLSIMLSICDICLVSDIAVFVLKRDVKRQLTVTYVSGINSMFLSVNPIMISLYMTYQFLHLSLFLLLIHHSTHPSVVSGLACPVNQVARSSPPLKVTFNLTQ